MTASDRQWLVVLLVTQTPPAMGLAVRWLRRGWRASAFLRVVGYYVMFCAAFALVLLSPHGLGGLIFPFLLCGPILAIWIAFGQRSAPMHGRGFDVESRRCVSSPDV